MLEDIPGLVRLQQAEEALRELFEALVNGESASHARNDTIDYADLLW